MVGNNSIPSLTNISLRVYKYSSFIGGYYGPLPIPTKPISSSVCMLQASWISKNLFVTSSQQLTPQHHVAQDLIGASGGVPPVHHPFGKIPFLFSPPEIFSTPVMAMLSLHDVNLGISVWYIDPVRNTPPDQLKPYADLTMVQPISTTPTFALVSKQPK